MDIKITQVTNRRELKDYIHLPSKIHKNHFNWIPPIYSDEWLYYDTSKNRAFDYSDTILFLAINEGKPVGRIMGIINNKYNKEHGELTARFCYLESFENYEVADALLHTVEDWARSKGMKRLIGPMGFSDKDPQGLLIEGFDQPVVISSNCNYSFLVDFVQKSGYQKDIDLVVYSVPVPKEIPDFYKKILERVRRNTTELEMLNITSRKELKNWVRPILTLVNETFINIYGFNPMEPPEMDEFASRYLAILDPRFFKVIVNSDGKAVAFILGIPDIGPGVKKSGGYLFPFGFIHILLSARKAKMLSLLLGAIHPNYRNLGLDTWMGSAILDEARKAGITSIDSHLELETNLKMRAEMEKMGGKVYKRYRIFQKLLD